MSDHTTLYRLYDASGALLYVGIAGNPGRRFEQHADDKPWWSEVAVTRLEHFDTRDAALNAERLAITSEQPRHNVVHNRGTGERRMLWTPQQMVKRFVHLGEADDICPLCIDTDNWDRHKPMKWLVADGMAYFWYARHAPSHPKWMHIISIKFITAVINERVDA